MPTKKTRVGFIPRNDVLVIIKELSYENNLSYSKIIGLLVEEALYKRGLFNIKRGNDLNKNIKNMSNSKHDNTNNDYNKLNYNFNNKVLQEKTLDYGEVKDELLDDDIYAKFLMFLQFQERMKNM